MAITDPHVLPSDVRFVPVRELPPSMRDRLEPHADAVAIVRPGSRLPVKLVDPDSADMLRRFAMARPIVDVVLEFSAERDTDARTTLAHAMPLLGHFVSLGLLVEEGAERYRRMGATLAPGDVVGEWVVVVALQALADVEVHQVRHPDGRIGALKIARADDAIAERLLASEAAILERLDGVGAPALLDRGSHDGRRYLVMAWCPGARVSRVAAELRALPGDERRRAIAQLASGIGGAFAALHARGVLHGDIHPGNVLVDAQGVVRLVDFGRARLVDEPRGARRARAGVPHFYEPELASALRRELAPLPPSVSGEVYAVGALLHLLATGVHYLDFALDRAGALAQIEDAPPRTFSASGAEPFPELEAVLRTALAKAAGDRHADMSAFARALDDVSTRVSAAVERSCATSASLASVHVTSADADALLAEIGIVAEEPRMASIAGMTPWPSDGAAGIGHALLRLAMLRDDAMMLAHADLWTARAEAMVEKGNDDGIAHGPEAALPDGPPRASDEGEPAAWGTRRVAPWSSASGVHLVRALLANAEGDAPATRRAVARFAQASAARSPWLDLTIGRAGTVLGCAILDETLSDARARAAVHRLGEHAHAELWTALALAPPVDACANAINAGIAHGWGGILFATMRWRAARGLPIDGDVRSRLAELAALASPVGRGVRWRWRNVLDPADDVARYQSGWCNGGAGLTHLWLLAHEMLGERAYLELARACAWHAWEDDESRVASICCGFAGRAYALLAIHRTTGERAWLERARSLGARALELTRARAGWRTGAGWGLYKGALGVALLLAELDHPEVARTPLFERD